MGYPKLDDLRSSLQRLPKNTAETADMGWDLISHVACTYALWVLPGTTPYQVLGQAQRGESLGPGRGKRKLPHELEQELKDLAQAAQTLVGKLEGASADCIAWLAQADGSWDNFFSQWFWIPQDWRGEGRDFSIDTDNFQADHLRHLVSELNNQAFFAGLHKQGEDGSRKETNTHEAKEILGSSLAGMVSNLGRPWTHAGQIGRKVHTWATGEQVDGRWLESSISRARERMDQTSSTVESTPNK